MANAPWIEPVAALGGQIMQTLERTATALERIATALEQKRDLSPAESTDKFVAALDAKLQE